MRIALYCLILLSLLFAPLNRVDVANLLPIEAVALYTDGESVVLETDTEHTGSGTTALQALEALKKNTPKVVYLDTAEYLLVSEDAVDQVESLRRFLKPSVRVCVCDAKDRVKDTAEYLNVHQKLPKLKAWKAENYTP